MSDARLTVGGLWADGAALARAHQAAIVWVAAMFIFLPQLAQALLATPPVQGSPLGVGNPLLTLGGAVIAVFGQLAIVALMLGAPTIGTALSSAFHRFPRAIVAVIIVGLMFVPVVLAVGVIATMLGIGGNAAQMARDPSRMATAVFPFVVAAIWVGARLSTLKATLISGNVGAWPSLKAAWVATKGHAWPLAGFLLSAGFAALALSGIIGMAGGATTALLFGKHVAGKLIVGTLSALAVTVIGVISEAAGVVAYRRLKG